MFQTGYNVSVGETCFAFLYYYPDISVSQCMSTIFEGAYQDVVPGGQMQLSIET